MSENLTEQYDGFAVYLPSLQKQYAEYATRSNNSFNRKIFPKNFKFEWLNFLDENSKLWSCGWALYSCGQFDIPQIRNRDIVRERDRANTTIIGDSGGFQLGTGAINSNKEKQHLERYKNDPKAQIENWADSGFRERTLRWLDRYTDYAMTLDMVLWAAESYNAPHAEKSQIRKLTVQQLIDLSVDNLRYFADNRGRSGKGTKFLSVLQDVGYGTGEQWYNAVKDFDFEGWALGSETGDLFNSIKWLRRLLDDKKLDKTELVHLLQKSPPVKSIVYTAAQRALRKALGRDNFTITFDSSSPHQLAGKMTAFALPPQFTNDVKTWKMSRRLLKQDVRIARREIIEDFEFYSPLAQYMQINDLMAHDTDDSDRFTDVYADQLLANHNIYTFHKASIDACNLVFSDTKKDHTKVPEKYLELCDLVTDYFTADNKDEIETRLAELTGYDQKDDATANDDYR